MILGFRLPSRVAVKRSVQTSTWPLPNQGVRFITPPCLCRTLARYPLGQACYPLALGYYPEAHGHHMQRCTPDNHLLIYCRIGCGWLECANERVGVGDGGLLVLSKGLEHAYGADPQRSWSIYWVHFEGLLVEDLLRPLGNAPCLRLDTQPRLLVEFDAPLALRRQGLGLPHFIHAAYLLQGLLTSLAVRPVRASLKSGWVLDIDAVRTLIHAHLHDNLNLDELAAQFKLPRFHFVKTYCALIGWAPTQDFIQMKMARVYHLLDEGVLETWQIAEQLGYADPYYFLRLLRKVVGMAPSHYWALHQG